MITAAQLPIDQQSINAVLAAPAQNVLLLIAFVLAGGFILVLWQAGRERMSSARFVHDSNIQFAKVAGKTNELYEALHQDALNRERYDREMAQMLSDNTAALGTVMETVSVLAQDLTGAVNSTGTRVESATARFHSALNEHDAKAAARFADVQNEIDGLKTEIGPLREGLQSLMIAIRENPCGDAIRQMLLDYQAALNARIERLEARITELTQHLQALTNHEGETNHENKTRPVYVSPVDVLRVPGDDAGAGTDARPN